MAEKNERANLRIHLSGNKYIISDGTCYWIVSESERHNKRGEMTTYQKRLSGYHSDFSSLMVSLFDRTIKTAEIDGELEDLARLVKKTRKEIKGWFSTIDKASILEGEKE